MSRNERQTCSLCKQEFVGYGNNPQPILDNIDARCCDHCNDWFVIPVRMIQLSTDNLELVRYLAERGGMLSGMKKVISLSRHQEERTN